MINNLSEGNVKKQLFKYILPIFATTLLQRFYAIADSIIAGQCLGMNALAAIGTTYPITMFFISIALGSNIGCSIIISRIFGEKNYTKLKIAIKTSIISCLLLSIVISIIGVSFSDSMIRLVKVPDNIIQESSTYLKYYMEGFTFLFLYNICTGIYIALGDSQTPFYLLVTSSILNVILNLLIVVVFNIGIEGLALATLISQGIAAIIFIILLICKMKELVTPKNEMNFSFHILKEIVGLSLPSILQQAIVSSGDLYMQSVINEYGSIIIAGYTGAIKLNIFAIAGFSAFGTGISGFIAQNIGAMKKHRIKQCIVFCTSGIIGIAFIFFIAFYIFPSFFIKFYLKENNSTAIAVGIDFLRITTPFYFVICLKVVADGILRGAGRVNKVMISTFIDLIVRIIFVMILSKHYGVYGVFAAYPIGWSVAFILSAILGFRCFKVLLKGMDSKGV